MSRGFQSDPITEYATLVELTMAVNAVHIANDNLRKRIRQALDDGCRSSVIADHLGWSRTTLYRYLRETD